MPHITLEYTRNIVQEVVPEAVFPPIHDLIAKTASLEIGHCKSRLVGHEDYHIGAAGTSGRPAFVHLTIRLLSGRTDAEKQAVSRVVLGELKEYFAPTASECELQISVEVQDLPRETYSKDPPFAGSRQKAGHE